MGEAAHVALSAIGKQDTYLLSKDPEDSFFNYKTYQHSNFRKFHRNRNVTPPSNRPDTWPFGETIKVQYNPQNMGDLLSNMYLSLTLPALEVGGNYADQVGRHILSHVKMFVDELEVETFWADWGILHDELYTEMSEKVANRFLVNRSLAFDSSQVSNSYAEYKSDVVIPLNFFFSRNFATDEYEKNERNRPYFPVCACHKQKIEFEFTFQPQTFFANTATTLSLTEFDIVTEEITLSPEERLYTKDYRGLWVTDVVMKHPTVVTNPTQNFIKNQLVPKIPVKSIHWFFRKTKFEDAALVKDPSETDEGNFYIHNRFNFSSTNDFDELNTFFNPVMDTAKFYIEGSRLPNMTSTDHTYFKYYIPYEKRLSRPIRNIYSYSFSMYPVNVQPSGSLDFSQIQSNMTTIECQLLPTSDEYSLHMYYTGYQTFKFEGGFMSLAY
tara:strand:+ start:5156 stop:6475 length:1320 start_codon:yes stop_codon:yes gene_type:complete